MVKAISTANMMPITVRAPAALVLSMNQPGSGARVRANSFATTGRRHHDHEQQAREPGQHAVDAGTQRRELAERCPLWPM